LGFGFEWYSTIVYQGLLIYWVVVLHGLTSFLEISIKKIAFIWPISHKGHGDFPQGPFGIRAKSSFIWVSIKLSVGTSFFPLVFWFECLILIFPFVHSEKALNTLPFFFQSKTLKIHI